MMTYPIVELDPVQRMRALAAGLPHAVYREAVFDSSPDRVWSLIGDLERGTPQFEFGVREAKIVSRSGDALELVATNKLGMKTRFDVVLRPGWCIMKSRAVQIGMAVAEEPDGRTRFAHFEQARVAGWLFWPILRANMAHDFRRIAEIMADSPD